MPHVLSDGVRIYYEELGNGEPLVLLSGQQQDHTCWNYVRDSYARYFRTIVFDYRGTGQSDAPMDPPYSLQMFARDALAILDYLHISRAHFFGQSMGGRLAQRIALDHPSRVGCVILGATTPGNLHGIKRAKEVDDLLTGKTMVKDRSQAFQNLMISPEWASRNRDYFLSLGLRRPLAAHVVVYHFAASEAHEAWDELPRLRCPVLVIHGDSDLINPSANGLLLAQRIPGAKLCWLQATRHGFHLERKEETLAAVREFIALNPITRARL